MKAAKLYEIGADFEAIIEQIIENDGELSEELEARLTAVERDFLEKAEAVALAVKVNEARAAMVQSEIERLQSLKRPYERTAASLKEYLRLQMARVEIKKIDRPRVKIWRQNNSQPSVTYTGNDSDYYSDLPFGVVREKVVRSLDREAILEMQMQHPEKIAEAPLVIERGEHLRIK